MFKGKWVLILAVILPLSVTAQSTIDQIRFTVNEYRIVGNNPLGDDAREILAPFTGEQFGLDGLAAAADALEQALSKAGYSFHRVSLPPQQLTTGSVELQVVRFTVGQIEISGNEFFDQENIQHSLPGLAVEQSPNTRELSRNLKLANTHPSKNVVLKFKEGETPDTIDAKLSVQDLNPQAFFITLDNSGSEDTEEWRTTLGYQHGNLFNRDHSITATLTTAPEDVNSTLQIGLSYNIPLYSQLATLNFLLSNSEVDTGVIAGDIEVSGKGGVFAVFYDKSLPASDFDHGASIGLQYKQFENDITIGTTNSSTDVLSLPLELGYHFSVPGQQTSWSGGLKLAANIPSGSNNDDEAYAASRFNAEKEWSWFKYFIAFDLQFAKQWLFHFGFSGQASDDLLISGEQFGVGGAGTLRGFEERSITGDAGYNANLELMTPPLTSQNIRFLIFSDHASVEFNDGETTDLSSAGLGVRWAWKQNLSLSLDYGRIIDGGGPDPTINQDDDDRAHLNLVYRF